jgi:hypothetical protein
MPLQGAACHGLRGGGGSRRGGAAGGHQKLLCGSAFFILMSKKPSVNEKAGTLAKIVGPFFDAAKRANFAYF